MVDVCFLVEGAYPYVTGGVSSWLHALIKNLPHFTFGVVHIGASPDPARKKLYTLPDNVKVYQEFYLHDSQHMRQRTEKQTKASYQAAWQEFYRFHEALALRKDHPLTSFFPALQAGGFSGLHLADLLSARESWEILTKIYSQFAPHESFLDFFWTFRLTYLPIFNVLEAQLPQARVYHAISTGFSGMLGALSRIRHGSAFLITEHGLYTREREIEITQSPWFSQMSVYPRKAQQPRMSFFQEWWFNIYRFMESLSYITADAVISITQINQRYQYKRGADPQKMLLVPNGIDIERFSHLRKQSAASQATYQQPLLSPFRHIPDMARTTAILELPQRRDDQKFKVGFIGRIVPIKDVKTFLRAIHLASEIIPQLEVYLVGPTEEDRAYYEECLQLVTLLNLETIIQFIGPADVRDYYADLHLVVLTSLSEGQPLVVMEGSCAGVPVIATDVGACRELLFGITAEDQALGASGIITAVASPNETAQAIVKLWQDKHLAFAMGRVGQERIRRFYRQEYLYQNYTNIYQRCMQQTSPIRWKDHSFSSRLLFTHEQHP